MRTKTTKALVALAFLSVSVTAAYGQKKDPGTPPPLDELGRFWVYRDGEKSPRLPFVPHGYMPAQASNMINLNLNSSENPHKEKDADKKVPESGDKCVGVMMRWAEPWWAGVAWTAGEGWGEKNDLKPYDLSGLKKKRLVLFARGKTGGEVIKFKLGILGNKPFGDAMNFPEEKICRLSTEWKEYVIDFSKVPADQLKRIASLALVAARDDQSGPSQTIRFSLDTIYIE